MKAYAYVLKSLKDGKLYIGSTSDMKRRLHEHNQGKNVSTKFRTPFILIYIEEYDSLVDARKREKVFKSSHSVLYKAAGWADNHK